MSELRDDLYQRLHGFKSVKRSHKSKDKVIGIILTHEGQVRLQV